MLNIDGLNNAPVADVAQAAMALLDRMQHHQPHVLVAGVATAFLALCQHHRADPAEVFRAVKNLLASNEAGRAPEFEALRLYLKHEVPR
jgi:hypothetical protein